jgi:hypothetical protein
MISLMARPHIHLWAEVVPGVAAPCNDVNRIRAACGAWAPLAHIRRRDQLRGVSCQWCMWYRNVPMRPKPWVPPFVWETDCGNGWFDAAARVARERSPLWQPPAHWPPV